jgi:hypothetical protein
MPLTMVSITETSGALAAVSKPMCSATRLLLSLVGKTTVSTVPLLPTLASTFQRIR